MSNSTISENILTLAEQIKSKMTVGEAGVIEVPKDMFEQTLEGTDLTMDMVKKVQSHTADVVSATGKALGDKGLEVFKKDGKVEQVSVQYPVHKDSVAGVFARTRSVPDGNGGMQDKHGVLSMNYKVSGAAGSKGSLKKVREHLSDAAKAALAG